MSFITAVVVDESGKHVTEPVAFSAKVLPAHEDTRFTCLRFVDPYGDTVFNRLQWPYVIEDIDILMESIRDADDKENIRNVRAFLVENMRETHVYLRFVSD